MKLLPEFTPALFLLVAVLVVFGGGKIARRFGQPESLGRGVALCIIAIAIGLSPATWRAAWAGGLAGDPLLTYTQMVGITGMLFLSGTRFNFAEIKHRHRLVLKIGIAATVLFVTVLLLAKSLGVGFGPMVLLGAAVVASSLWFPGERGRSDQHDVQIINWQVAALTFTASAFLAVYFFDVFSTSSRPSFSLFVYIVITAYEVVKLFVLFGFAYFICSRFLARAEGRVSNTRTTIGFVLITVLIFGLAVITTNQLAVFAWAFVAGALWQRSEIGTRFGDGSRPAASATLISLAFVPLMLQTHGRDLIGVSTLIVFAVFVITIKMFVAWLSITHVTRSKQLVMRVAVMLALPGEIAIALLGFGITRWAITGPVYFPILGYALISTILSPAIWPTTTSQSSDLEKTKTHRQRLAEREKGVTHVFK